MPQQVSPFQKIVDFVRDYVEQINPAYKECGCKGYVPMADKISDIKTADLKTMATNPNSYPAFQMLYSLKKIHDGRSPKTNAPLADPVRARKDADQALEQLKPKHMSLEQFIQEIESAEQARQMQTKPLLFVPKLPGKGLTGMFNAHPEIQFSDDQSMKTPEFSQAALAAVKDLKQTAVRAA